MSVTRAKDLSRPLLNIAMKLLYYSVNNSEGVQFLSKHFTHTNTIQHVCGIQTYYSLLHPKVVELPMPLMLIGGLIPFTLMEELVQNLIPFYACNRFSYLCIIQVYIALRDRGSKD